METSRASWRHTGLPDTQASKGLPTPPNSKFIAPYERVAKDWGTGLGGFWYTMITNICWLQFCQAKKNRSSPITEQHFYSFATDVSRHATPECK